MLKNNFRNGQTVNEKCYKLKEKKNIQKPQMSRSRQGEGAKEQRRERAQRECMLCRNLHMAESLAHSLRIVADLTCPLSPALLVD